MGNSFRNIKLNDNILTINGTDYILDGTATISDNNNSSFKGISCTDNGNGTCTLIVNGAQITVSGEEYTPVIIPYLTFSSPYSFTLKVYNNKKHWDGILEYSTDTETWSTWDGTTTLSSTSVGDVKYLYLRGSNNTKLGYSSYIYSWVLSGSAISCEGNIENLLDYQMVLNGNHPPMATSCYANMFYNCTSLISAPELPATTLANQCYYHMFDGCTSLTSAPKLPATTLANSCYAEMFSTCTSLTTSPALPSTVLVNNCYNCMFRATNVLPDCSNIDFTSSTVVNSGGLKGLFAGTKITDSQLRQILPINSTTNRPYLPVTTLSSECYSTMFASCTSLTSAPELPATTLVRDCYYYMFYNCSSLTTPAIMGNGTTQVTAANNCCYYMYYGCTSLNLYTTSTNHTPFYKAITYSTTVGGTNGRSSYRMFYNCKIDGATSTADYITAGTQLYY